VNAIFPADPGTPKEELIYNNDILICITQKKAEEEFAIEDWQKASLEFENFLEGEYDAFKDAITT
jgi:hypothetical protein